MALLDYTVFFSVASCTKCARVDEPVIVVYNHQWHNMMWKYACCWVCVCVLRWLFVSDPFVFCVSRLSFRSSVFELVPSFIPASCCSHYLTIADRQMKGDANVQIKTNQKKIKRKRMERTTIYYIYRAIELTLALVDK